MYHVMSRGVDKRDIFMDDKDRARFIHDLFEFNDEQSANNTSYRFKNNDIVSRYIAKREPRKLLVNVLAFCLMPNHYHLLLTPRFDNSVSKFMKKLNIGYAKYFNERYKRKGTLFEGRYKSIIVKNESHFIHLPYYIHLNPLDLKYKEWRDRKLQSVKGAMKFLDSYRWSSHLDYCGEHNFPSVTQRDFLMRVFDSPERYRQRIKDWLSELDLSDVKGFTLEN